MQANGHQQSETLGRAFGYVRVSRTFQAKGTSLDEQSDKIARYFKLSVEPRSIEWAGFVTDKCSGRIPIANRPFGSKLTQNLRKGDHLIISALSRAFRSARDALVQVDVWDRCGIIVHLLDLQMDLS